MALIKFGSIVTSGSGSVGGQTIQNSRGGMQLRNKPINKKQPSAAQQLIRSFNPQMQAGWLNLSDQQRKSWGEYAVSYQVCNCSGEKHPLSGHSLWLKYQFAYISNGFSFQSDPFIASAGPLGPELVLNGSFIDSSHWSIIGSWSISGGFANYLDLSVNRITQTTPILNGVQYRISFNIANCVSSCWIIFAFSGGSALFTAPFNTWVVLSDGFHSFDVTGISDAPGFAIWGSTSGSTYSLTSVSIRKLI